MSEQVLVGRDSQGQPVYAEVLTTEETIERLKATDEWKTFAERFDMSIESNNKLLWFLYVDKLGEDPSVEDYQRLLKAIVGSGGVVSLRTIKDDAGKILLEGNTYEFELRPVEPEPVVEQVPVDRNGHPLSQAQIAWGEMTRWANDPNTTTEMIHRRRGTDSAFATFYRLNISREAVNTPHIELSIAGQATTENRPAATPELVAWAEEFRRTPMDRVRALKSPAMNPLGYELYVKNLEAALAAGLVGR